jgi:hypothetical protein
MRKAVDFESLIVTLCAKYIMDAVLTQMDHRRVCDWLEKASFEHPCIVLVREIVSDSVTQATCIVSLKHN